MEGRKGMSMQNNNKALTAIDTTTGEIVPYQEEIDATEVIPGTAAMAHILNRFCKGSPLPVHIYMLEEENFSIEEKDDLVSLYLGSEPLRFDQVNNMRLPVWGAIIYQHPGYNGMDKLFHPEGFYQLRLLVELKGELKVVASGSTTLAMVWAYKLQRRKWWYFDSPIEFEFSKDSKNRHHMMEVYPTLSKRLKREERTTL
jgi:hypothetical protein